MRTTSRMRTSSKRSGCGARIAWDSSAAARRRWTPSSKGRSALRSSPPRLTSVSRGLVAIVGRPNVGKSTLFNRLVGERVAIVEDEPGTTRDRLYATAEWRGREFTLVDTGGPSDAPRASATAPRRQAEAAIAEDDLVVFVVDAQSGILPVEHDVADLLRRSRKPIAGAPDKAQAWRAEAQAAA